MWWGPRWEADPAPRLPRSQAFDDCTTLAATFKLLDSFEGLLEREVGLRAPGSPAPAPAPA